MRKAGITVILILLLGLPVLLGAQDIPSDDIWDDYNYNLFERGDQTFLFSLGTSFPLFFINESGIIDHKIDPPVGGAGSLGVNYYLSPYFFLGGEGGGMFLPTIGKSTLYIVHLGFKTGFQLIGGRFEFPISASIGISWQNFLDHAYFGLYMKAAGSVFYRATADWAFGLTSSMYWFPQWIRENRSQNVNGFFLDLTLSARYQF